MKNLWARLELIVNNRSLRRILENCPHLCTEGPQLSRQRESMQDTGAKDVSKLSQISAGLIYYY
jgi:hypothetical protein